MTMDTTTSNTTVHVRRHHSLNDLMLHRPSTKRIKLNPPRVNNFQQSRVQAFLSSQNSKSSFPIMKLKAFEMRDWKASSFKKQTKPYPLQAATKEERFQENEPNKLTSAPDFYKLRGGSPMYPCAPSSPNVAMGASSIAARMICWLLNWSASATLKPLDGGTNDDDSCSSSQCSSETDDSVAESVVDASGGTPSTNVGTSFTISSQAEAYFEFQHTKHEPHDDDLEYTITQMDVMRMMRNASRHLDVDCILKLPVYTYQEPTRINNEQQLQNQSDFSWLLVPSADPTMSQEQQPKQETLDACVICLEHFVTGDRLRVLPACQHKFHTGCIDRWLSGSSSFDDCVTSGCPTCKKRAVVDEHEGFPSWAFVKIGENALARSSTE
jgi:hypothetical protein